MLLYFGNRTGNMSKDAKYFLKILLVACKKAITRIWYKPDPGCQGCVKFCSHMQGEHGRHGLVVADCVAHVTPVRVLRHFGGPAQPGGETPLQRCSVGRDRGAGATQAPQDAVGPGRFPLLGTEGCKRKPGTVLIEIIIII